MRMSRLRFAIWVMVVGLIIILLKEFRLDNIEAQK